MARKNIEMFATKHVFQLFLLLNEKGKIFSRGFIDVIKEKKKVISTIKGIISRIRERKRVEL